MIPLLILYGTAKVLALFSSANLIEPRLSLNWFTLTKLTQAFLFDLDAHSFGVPGKLNSQAAFFF